MSANATQNAMISCPHCGAANVMGGQFCQSCGKALPVGQQTGPRIVTGSSFATTTAGQKLQSDELTKTAKKASGALLAVAILSTLGAALFYWIMTTVAKRGQAAENVQLFVILAGVQAAVFWGLWAWSLKQPLPAAIVGLILYGTLVAINVISAVSSMNQGGPQRGLGGLGISWLDLIILGVLGQAIAAGSRHRKLLQQQQQQTF